jgi:hypothetical protein
MKEVQKDPIRAKRLDEVYKHLFAHFGITSQKHLAEVLKVQRTGLSSAFNGNVANLTDNLFKKICAAFPGVFNLDYLLTGKGDLLTVEENVKSTELEKANRQMHTQSSATGIDSSSIINAALAAQMQTIESLKSEQATLLEAHAREIASMNQQIADKQAIIDLQSDKIKSQADEIARLQKVIADLRSMSLSADIEEYISNNPFPIGVADKTETPRAQV